jgi:rubrerythrin
LKKSSERKPENAETGNIPKVEAQAKTDEHAHDGTPESNIRPNSSLAEFIEHARSCPDCFKSGLEDYYQIEPDGVCKNCGVPVHHDMKKCPQCGSKDGRPQKKRW